MTNNMSPKTISGFDLLKFIMALIIVNIHVQLVDVAEGLFMYHGVILMIWLFLYSLFSLLSFYSRK